MASSSLTSTRKARVQSEPLPGRRGSRSRSQSRTPGVPVGEGAGQGRSEGDQSGGRGPSHNGSDSRSRKRKRKRKGLGLGSGDESASGYSGSGGKGDDGDGDEDGDGDAKGRTGRDQAGDQKADDWHPILLTPVSANAEAPFNNNNSLRRIVHRHDHNQHHGHADGDEGHAGRRRDDDGDERRLKTPASASTGPNSQPHQHHQHHQPRRVHQHQQHVHHSGPARPAPPAIAMPRHTDGHPAKRFLTDDYRSYYARPSPPPITTLSQSPSLSSDTSSISSPPTVLPSLLHPSHHDVPSANYITSSTIRHSSGAYSPSSHYAPYYGDTVSPDVFHPHHAHPHPSHSPHSHYAQPAYAHPYSNLSMRPSSGGNGASVPSPMQTYNAAGYHGHHHPHGHHGHHGHGHAHGYEPIYTSDAATKLNDRVRRRCYNCRSTDTSTWRRSSLHPGKVLCNKCGLFERTHSKNRPPQFPNKRGPSAHLTSPTFGERSPPSLPPPIPQTQNTQQPHHMTHAMPQHHMRDSAGVGLGLSGAGNTNGVQGQGQGQQTQSQSTNANVPPHPTHPSLDPAYTHSNTLPQIQEWLRGTSNGNGNGAANTGTTNGGVAPSSLSNNNAASNNANLNQNMNSYGQQQQQQQQKKPDSISSPSMNGNGNGVMRQSVLTPSPSPTRSPSPVGLGRV